VLRSVKDAAGVIVDFRIEAINGSAQQLTGLDRDALIGTTILTILPSYRENGIFEDVVKAVLQGGTGEVAALLRAQALALATESATECCDGPAA
jgi:hypothetical protein